MDVARRIALGEVAMWLSSSCHLYMRPREPASRDRGPWLWLWMCPLLRCQRRRHRSKFGSSELNTKPTSI
jgi:hypothetical protein